MVLLLLRLQALLLYLRALPTRGRQTSSPSNFPSSGCDSPEPGSGPRSRALGPGAGLGSRGPRSRAREPGSGAGLGFRTHESGSHSGKTSGPAARPRGSVRKVGKQSAKPPTPRVPPAHCILSFHCQDTDITTSCGHPSPHSEWRSDFMLDPVIKVKGSNLQLKFKSV